MNKNPKNPDLIFGIHPIIEAINNGKTINKIMVQQGVTAPEIMELAKEHNLSIQFVPREKIAQFTNAHTQGVIALISPIDYAPFEETVAWSYENFGDPLVLILDQLTDVRNFGAIARTFLCMGGSFIVVPDKNSVSVTSDAVKTSAGALLKVPVCRVPSLIDAIKYLKDSGFMVTALTEQGNKKLHEIEFNGPIALVAGSEELGISNNILRVSDNLANIDMEEGTINSLNVSVAAAMALYEIRKQKKINL